MHSLWIRLVAYLIVDQIIGGLWYSPIMFGNAWIRIVMKNKEPKPTLLPFIVSWCCSLSLAIMMDHWFQHQTQFSALETAVALALVIASADAPHMAFSGWPMTLYCITVAHKVTQLFSVAYLMEYFHRH